MKIRKNDTVMVIAGRDKGKSGKVRYAYPKKGRVLVEGVNFVKKHAPRIGVRGRPFLHGSAAPNFLIEFSLGH